LRGQTRCSEGQYSACTKSAHQGFTQHAHFLLW
jgi:hypothetical protein